MCTCVQNVLVYLCVCLCVGCMWYVCMCRICVSLFMCVSVCRVYVVCVHVYNK